MLFNGHIDLNNLFISILFSQQAATEQEEEQITNTLLKRMEQIKKERDTLALQVRRFVLMFIKTEYLIFNLSQVEQEEEYLTNTLQKKLSTVGLVVCLTFLQIN